MNERTLQALEVTELISLLARHVQTPLGRHRALALGPSTDAALLDVRLNRTTECAAYLASGGGFGLSGIEDPERALSQLQIEGASLEPRDILELQRLIVAGNDLRSQFTDDEARHRYRQLFSVTSQIPDLRRLLASIRGKDRIAETKIANLKRVKDDVREVQEGVECGISLAGAPDLQVGDLIEVWELKKVERKL